MRFLFISFFVFILSFSSLSAQILDSEQNAWSVFSVKQDGAKICYITSSPIKTAGNYKRRGIPYLLVTYRDKNTSEVSVSSGYPYKDKSIVAVTIDKKSKYELFTTSETPKIAWANNAKEDKKLISNMKKGTKVEAKGFSKLGTHSVDTYSLIGFTKAFSRMQALCGKK